MSLFLVLEGIDGSGKTTQSRLLASWLRDRGEHVVETREPTDGEWGRRYRRWARSETTASADEVSDFFIYDRREHVDALIRPALAAGSVVVCDRYVGSTLAYQVAHGVDREKLHARLDAERFPEPDLVLWLRMPVEQALARLGGAASERYERRDFLERVDAEYARLGYDPVDASGPVDAVQASIRTRVAPLCGWRRR